MSDVRIKSGLAPIAAGNNRLFILDETGQARIASAPASELIGLLHRGLNEEDDLIAALKDRFPLERIYYALLELEKEGIIVRNARQQDLPAHLFRSKVHGRDRTGYPDPPLSSLAVRILAVGGAESAADSLAASLSRSDILEIERLRDGYGAVADPDTVFIVATPDALEPELEAFGRLAYQRGLHWLPVKLNGIIPQIGPLFLPDQGGGCVACLLDRIKGHRRHETEQILEKGNRHSLHLSVGQTVFSLETAVGLLAVELERLAAGGASELAGAAVTLDFRKLCLDRHTLKKRPQCPLCGTLSKKNIPIAIPPQEPLELRHQVKADYRDGGERICSAVETLEKFAFLISPVTGIVSRLTPLAEIPSCFGSVFRSDWIVRNTSAVLFDERNGRLAPLGFSTGKGRTKAQAKASALGEAVERYCSQYEGFEPSLRAPLAELGDRAITPQDLMGFSRCQYRDRAVWRQKGSTAYVPDPYDAERPIDWTPAWSLSQQRWRLIPSAFAYYFYPREGGGDVCMSCSNGVAAGNCFEEAILQGFFELVERDATAMWWYHKLRKPALEWHSFDSPYTAAVDAAMNEMGMRLEILDLTSDLGIPVFAANAFNCREGGRFHSIGLGCHRNPLIALERAVAELGQCWRLAYRDEYSLRFQDTPLSRELFLQADPHLTPRVFTGFPREEHGDFLDDIEDAVRLLRTRGLEMLVMDLTRPDVGFPVARVIVPGLLHFWPRFGCRRLFEVPKTSEWIDGDTREEDLNPVPFYL